jgi:predicted unusual protein kinase regulating ubiquinone biosynthesis (AarF/ABC1/UbiB family)
MCEYLKKMLADFEQEAHNAERTAKMFQGNANVKIPRILWVII